MINMPKKASREEGEIKDGYCELSFARSVQVCSELNWNERDIFGNKKFVAVIEMTMQYQCQVYTSGATPNFTLNRSNQSVRGYSFSYP